jgi:hypothetical protein
MSYVADNGRGGDAFYRVGEGGERTGGEGQSE